MRHGIILIIYIIAVAVIFPNESFSQDKLNTADVKESFKRVRNNLNVSLLGNASVIAGQFETSYFVNKKISFTLGLGVGYNEEITLYSDNSDSFVTFPFHFTFNLVRKDKHLFMFGVGYTYVNFGDQDEFQQKYNSNYIYPLLGYRVQFKHINFGPYISYPIYPKNVDPFDEVLFIPFGFIIGFSF